MRLIPKSLMERIYDKWKRQGMSAQDLADEYGIHKHTMCKYLRQFEKGVVEEWL